MKPPSPSPVVSLSNHGSGGEEGCMEKTGVNMALHLTAILLRFIVAGELDR